jgi:uncharacterized protein YodC (DUF2158 family)
MTSKFKVGDKVRIANGITMTVNIVKTAEDGSLLYSCMWLEGINPRSDDFAESLIEIAPKPRRGGTKKIGSFG